MVQDFATIYTRNTYMIDMPSVTIADIEQAAKEIKGHIVRTPFVYAPHLSKEIGAEIYCKCETSQETGSFKERGASYCLQNLPPKQRKKGVIANSAGNHAQGLACHAQRLGIPAVIVMPEDAPNVKINNTKKYGAKVILHEDFVGAGKYAEKLMHAHGYTFVHAFNNKYIMAGQGTCGMEMLQDVPDLDAIVVPVGGGGLMSGVAIYAKHINPNIKIYGVQAKRYPYLKEENPTVDSDVTIAEGIAIKQPGPVSKLIAEKYIEEIFLVSESQMEHAMCRTLISERILVEGAGSAGVAGVIANADVFRSKKVGVILSGGNVDQTTLASILLRNLVSTGRLNRLIITGRDRPGLVHKVTGIIAGKDGNIIDVYHRRLFEDIAVQETSIEITLEMPDSSLLESLICELNQNGFNARIV